MTAYGGSVDTSLSRGRLTTDIVLAGVFGLVCLPFALLGNVVKIPTPWLIGVGVALAIALIVDLWRKRGRGAS